MSKSDKNSCKKDCPCTKCKGSQNDLEEKFSDYVKSAVGRAMTEPGYADNAAVLGPAQSAATTVAGVMAKDAVPHIKKAAQKTVNKIKRFAKNIKSPETRYRDFQDKVHDSTKQWNPARGKAVRKAGDIAVSKGVDPGYYPWDKRPSYLKIFESKEGQNSMSVNLEENADIHYSALKAAHKLSSHSNVYAKSHGQGALDHIQNGDYNSAKADLDLGNMWARDHDRIKDAAGSLLNSNNKLAASHAKETLYHLNVNHDHEAAMDHLKRAQKAHQFNLKEESLPDQTPLTKVGATKTGEKLVPEKRKEPSIPANPVTKVNAGKTGEVYAAKLAEEENNLNEVSEKLAQKVFLKRQDQYNKSLKTLPQGKQHVGTWRMEKGKPTLGFDSMHPKTSELLGKANKSASILHRKRDARLQQNETFNDISAHRDFAVEASIQEIMRESNKKRKMMEDATNIHIATPEQRQDWLEVSRGAMDVMNYINKYKV
jgi:hypothetical protein